MRTIQLQVDGMRCRRCVRHATALLRDLPGIATVSVDRGSGRVTVRGEVSGTDLVAAFASTSFTVRVEGPGGSGSADLGDGTARRS